MRTHVKKIQYRRHVRAQLQTGLANRPDGSWGPVSEIRDSAVQDRAKKISARAKP